MSCLFPLLPPYSPLLLVQKKQVISPLFPLLGPSLSVGAQVWSQELGLGFSCVSLNKCLTLLAAGRLLFCGVMTVPASCICMRIKGTREMMHVKCLAHRKPSPIACCYSFPPLPEPSHWNILLYCFSSASLPIPEKPLS